METIKSFRKTVVGPRTSANWTATVEASVGRIGSRRWMWRVETLGLLAHTVSEGEAETKREAKAEAMEAAAHITASDVEAAF